MSTFDHEERDGDARSEVDFDDYSELGPDDSASQIGKVVTTEELRGNTQRVRASLGDSYAKQWMNGSSPPAPARLSYRPDYTSRRESARSSRVISPTTMVPSKRDRVRYSWQSIQADEPNRPRIHVVKIVSNTATASAGLPGGESFGFAISPGGRRIACYNSARLFILQAAALPVNISQEYSLRRRPLAVEVVDECNVLAVLADEHSINVYDLSNHRVRRLKTFKTDYPTSVIALSPTGGVLAAGYEGGVEIFSLDPNALSTDRRAARTEKMDRLQFSEDGSTLIGTTTRVDAAATVFIAVPVFPASENGVPSHEELKAAWCTNMLEPINILDSSHATFLRESSGANSEKLFAWNAAEDTFGILNSHNLQYGNVFFPVTISPPLSTCGGLGAAIHSVPAFDERGETVGMVVNDRTIRLYMVPQADEDATRVEAHSIDHELDEEFGCPFSDIRWVQSSASLPAPKGDSSQVSGRLVVVSPGGVVDPSMAEDAVAVADVEQGRIILFDFDPQYAGQPGQTFTFTLGKAPPQTLDEQEMDVAQEVALVRRRTTNNSQKIGQKTATIGRTASMASRRGNDRSLGLTRALLERSQSQPAMGSYVESHQGTLLHNGLADVEETAEEPHNGLPGIYLRTNGFNPVQQHASVPNTPLSARFHVPIGLEAPILASSPVAMAGGESPVSRRSADTRLPPSPFTPGPMPLRENSASSRTTANHSPMHPSPMHPSPMHPSPIHPGSTIRTALHGGYPIIISPVTINTELRTPTSINDGWNNGSPTRRLPAGPPRSPIRPPVENVNHGLTITAIVAEEEPNGPRLESRAEIELREYQRLEQEQQQRLRQQREDEQISEQQRLERERKEREERDREEERLRIRDRVEQRNRFERRIVAHHAQFSALQGKASKARDRHPEPPGETPRYREGGRLDHEPFSAPDLTIDETRFNRISHSVFATIPNPVDTPHLGIQDLTPTSSTLASEVKFHHPDITHDAVVSDKSPGGLSLHAPIAVDRRRHSYLQTSGTLADWQAPPTPSIGNLSTYSVGRPSSAPGGIERRDTLKKKKVRKAQAKTTDDGQRVDRAKRKCVVM